MSFDRTTARKDTLLRVRITPPRQSSSSSSSSAFLRPRFFPTSPCDLDWPKPRKKRRRDASRPTRLLSPCARIAGLVLGVKVTVVRRREWSCARRRAAAAAAVAAAEATTAADAAATIAAANAAASSGCK